ncbi:MAG: hypothetical protein AB7O28_11740 [Vicinamibacterales bacterium]
MTTPLRVPPRAQPLRAALAPPLDPPPPSAFTPRERALVARLATPGAVQRWLNALPYNAESGGETLRTFRGVVQRGTAHCLEAALFAAVALEQHGYPPLLLSFESIDHLDHVIFVYRGARGWGSVARSRDPGLHGRRPVFATPRALALSYVDPYVDFTGRVRGYAVVHLAAMGGYDWRFSTGNVWAVERLLIAWPHHRIRTSDARYRRLKRRYRAYREAHGRKPLYYRGRDRWSPLPAEYLTAPPNRDRSRGSAS